MRDLGDFQTPPALVAAVLDRLGPIGARWPRVLEPTCGRGYFLAGLLAHDSPPREIVGIEIQKSHLDAARALAAGSVRIGLKCGSLFDVDLIRGLEWQGNGPLLVVGNPPWVTNSELGALGSGNGPRKSNVKRDRGLDAMTGASNFDIAEAVWLKLLTELAGQEATIALLCKTSVARRVLEYVRRTGLLVESAEFIKIDAKAWFGAAAEACLLRVTLGTERLERIPVFDRLDAKEPVATMGFIRGRLVADLDGYRPHAFVDGSSALTWRQGLKHDAAGVMELTPDAQGTYRNGNGDAVNVEAEHVFPLLKGTDLARPGPVVPRRAVIVTQRKVGEDTRHLERDAPRLWSYLQANAHAFDRRKSSVYRSAPPFAMFGVGPYSFDPYKVVVSGLHGAPRFHAVGPFEGRPLMLDDTGYALGCRSPEQAALAAALLNLPEAVGLLRALAFPGAKRPVTKAALQRIDLRALLHRSDRAAILESAAREVERLTGRAAVRDEPLERLLEPEIATAAVI